MKYNKKGLCKLNKRILWAQQQAYKQVKDDMVFEKTWIGFSRLKYKVK